jgi:hypothetical protein
MQQVIWIYGNIESLESVGSPQIAILFANRELFGVVIFQGEAHDLASPSTCIYKHRAKFFLSWKLAKCGPQRRNALCSQSFSDFVLSSLPRWEGFAKQCLTLVRYFDHVASAIFARREPEPTLSAHSLDVAAKRRFVQLKRLDQLGGPSLFAVCHRY